MQLPDFSKPLHCGDAPPGYPETEEAFHSACDCPDTLETCRNEACCNFCHHGWVKYVAHEVTEFCRPDCPMRERVA